MPEINRRQRQKLGYTYTFLSDPKAKRFDVTICCMAVQDPKARALRVRQSFSSISGTIRWVNLTENIAVRARPEQVLNVFDEMQTKAGP
jgi:hypothetical protein